MALNVNLTPPCLPLRHPPTLFPAHTILLSIKHTHHQNPIHSPSPPRSTTVKLKASSKEVENAETPAVSELLDDETLNRISSVKEASEVLTIVADKSERNGGVVSSSDCGLIIRAALERNNAELAFSVYSAMRMSFDQESMKRFFSPVIPIRGSSSSSNATSTNVASTSQSADVLPQSQSGPSVDVLPLQSGVSQTGSFTERWKWARPDVHIYASLVKGLASSLRVSDAIRIIYDVCQIGIYSGDEVSFGKVVRCPSCMIAVAVVQPQHGTQIASCSKCRYQYEFVSGNIVTIESEQISMDIPAWERGLRFLSVMKQSIPAAVHSIVVQTPSGTARTHRFATKTVELPAQEGERVTISLAAPSNVYREVGPFRFNSKAPGFNPGEAMCLTNHTNGRESQLLRASIKNENLSLRNPSVLFPVLALLTTGDIASGIIDPNLPQLISVAAVASVALGTTINNVVLPQLNRVGILSCTEISFIGGFRFAHSTPFAHHES